jgi:hypothetical protein
MPLFTKLPLLCALLLCAPLGCGPQEVGEECDDIGDDDECEDGAICTNDGPSGDGYCAWICENNDHCQPDFECKDIRDSHVKSCQPR